MRRRRVPRAELRALKLPLLEAAFTHWRGQGEAEEHRAFERFADDNRHWLPDYALFRALKERLAWVQWEDWPNNSKSSQPQSARGGPPQLQDRYRCIATGVLACTSGWRCVASWRLWGSDQRGPCLLPARDSADVWANQELFDLDRSVGAPPDAFSSTGRRWGLPMPNWPRMRADDLLWWRARARHAAGLFDLLRIDHVVGFYRTYSFGPDPRSSAVSILRKRAPNASRAKPFSRCSRRKWDRTRRSARIGHHPALGTEVADRTRSDGAQGLEMEKKDWALPMSVSSRLRNTRSFPLP